jgi:hypothetical protein
MPRLPNVGDDSGEWGTILNEYLSVAHTPEGKLMLERWADNVSRPESPVANQFGFNEDTQVIEQYDGSDWVTLVGGDVSGVTGDGTGVTDKDAFQSAIGLKDVGFYDDFSRYSDGYEIGRLVTTPLVGPTYTQNWTNSSMYTEGGGLSCPVDGNNYLGSAIATPDGILDVTFDMVVVSPSGKYQRNAPGFTFAFKESQIVPDNGSGLGISGGIHINIEPNGVTDKSHFQQSTPVTNLTKGDQTFTFPNTPVGPSLTSSFGGSFRWRVNIRVEGNRLDITSRGRTLSYECSAYGGRVGNPLTYFYFQLNNATFPGLPAPADRNYARLERMWANAPALSARAALGGVSSSRFDGNPNAVYPNQIRIQPGDLPLLNNLAQTVISSKTLMVGGATVVDSILTGGGLYVEGKMLQASPVNGGGVTSVVLSGTSISAVVQSPVNVSAANITGLPRLVGLPAGHTETSTLCGTFGANGNTKRIMIREAGGNVFDTGDITQNGGCWKLVIRRQSLTAVSTNFFFEFWSTQTGTILTNVGINRGLTFTTFALHATGVALGDVTIGFSDSYTTQSTTL